MPTFRTTRKQRGRGSGGITGKGFTPGKSGNPSGRPQGFVGFIRKGTNDGEELASFMLKIFRGGSISKHVPKLKEQIEAATWLADRGFGKPVQANGHEIQKETQNPFDPSRLTHQELVTLERILLKAQLTDPA